MLATNISQDCQIKSLDERSGQNSGTLPTELSRVAALDPSWLSGRRKLGIRETFIVWNIALRLALPDWVPRYRWYRTCTRLKWVENPVLINNNSEVPKSINWVGFFGIYKHQCSRRFSIEPSYSPSSKMILWNMPIQYRTTRLLEPAKSPTVCLPPPAALFPCYAFSIWCPFCSPPLLALRDGLEEEKPGPA